MNLNSLFTGLGTAPPTGVTGGYGYNNWIIWIIIIGIIIWFGRYNFGFGRSPNLGYPGYSGYNGCGYPSYPGYPGYPGAGPFGGSLLWFIIAIVILVWLLGGVNRI